MQSLCLALMRIITNHHMWSGYNSLVKNCNHKGLGIYYLLSARSYQRLHLGFLLLSPRFLLHSHLVTHHWSFIYCLQMKDSDERLFVDPRLLMKFVSLGRF